MCIIKVKFQLENNIHETTYKLSPFIVSVLKY